MSNTTITEACGCGATFTITTTYSSSAGQLADRPKPIMFGDVEVGRPWCELKAGHTGAHSDGEGHWTHAGEPTACAGRCACGEAVRAEAEGEA